MREQVLAANVDIASSTQGAAARLQPAPARALPGDGLGERRAAGRPADEDRPRRRRDAVPRRGRDGDARRLSGRTPSRRRTGEGLDEMRAYFAGNRTAVLLGSSGVGKSTIVNALAGEELHRDAEVREDDQRGRHTTTRRELVAAARRGRRARHARDPRAAALGRRPRADVRRRRGDRRPVPVRRLRHAASRAARCARRSPTARFERRALGQLRASCSGKRARSSAPRPPPAFGTRPGVQDPWNGRAEEQEALSGPQIDRGRGRAAPARSGAAGWARSLLAPGGAAAAAGAAVRTGRRRLAAALPAPAGRPARVPARASTAGSRPTRPTRSVLPGPWGDKSVVEWPEYAPPAWLDTRRRRGPDRGLELRSRRLVARVRVLLYRTPEAPGDDGAAARRARRARVRAVLAALTRFFDAAQLARRASRRCRPRCIQPVDRNETYSRLGALRRRARRRSCCRALARRAPHGPRVGIGASLGALALLHAHRRHPRTLRRAAAAVGQLLPAALRLARGGVPALRAHHAVRRHRPARRARRGRSRSSITCGTAEENLDNNRAVAEALGAPGIPELAPRRAARRATTGRAGATASTRAARPARGCVS